MRWLLVLTALAGCLRDPAVHCDDGRVCPPGTLCDNVHALCVLPAQTTVCREETIADGEVCTAAGVPGICDQSYCVPGCGDGNHAANEECDDGNFASHDGCSSRCLIESPVWNEWHPAWTTRQGLGAVYATFDGTPRLVLFSGTNQNGFVTDMWERGAARTWSRVATPAPARASSAVAYDPDRHVIVAFGGGNAGVFGDTLEYDGHEWIERHPPVAPSPRTQASMLYDPIAHRIVLFGGGDAGATYADTWLYDGTTWTEVTPAVSPLPRFGAVFAWDSIDQRGVLFGGIGASVYDDTWEYANGTWTEVTSVTHPPARFWGSFAELPPDGLVLFGGALTGYQAASDTWKYTSATGWTAVTGQPVNPPARGLAAFVYDPSASAAVLIGGSSQLTADALSDVWELDTAGWTDRTPEFSPSPRSTAIAYDEARQRAVLFGDLTPFVAQAQTWTFDGAAWANVSPQASSIGPRFDHSLVYDGKHQRIVTFGTSLFGDDRETWFWNGSTWTNHTRPDKPPGRARPGLAFDSARGVIVMFGGYTQSLGHAIADTWELDDETWTQVPTATTPPAQDTPAVAYDPVSQQTILFGEDGTTWAYAQRDWHVLVPASDATPAPRTGCAFLFDPQRKRVFMYGGAHPVTHEVFTDVWELDNVGWHPIEQQIQGPSQRRIVHMGAIPRARGLLLFGGTGSGNLDDTWIFSYRSGTPDEDCTNGMDDDGDAHVDRDDPDCGS